jgi:hypothetical protein
MTKNAFLATAVRGGEFANPAEVDSAETARKSLGQRQLGYLPEAV